MTEVGGQVDEVGDGDALVVVDIALVPPSRLAKIGREVNEIADGDLFVSGRVSEDFGMLGLLKINNAEQILSGHSLFIPGQGTTTLDFSAFDINDNGQVVGSIGWCDGCPAGYPATAVRWTAARGVDPIGNGEGAGD